jgi:hypothetical protein
VGFSGMGATAGDGERERSDFSKELADVAVVLSQESILSVDDDLRLRNRVELELGPMMLSLVV